MAQPTGSIFKGVAEFELEDGSIAQNVFYFLADFLEDQTEVDILAAVEKYIEDIYNAVSTYLTDGFTVNSTDVMKMEWDETEGKWYTSAKIGSISPTITHTNTDDAFPNQIAPVLVANTPRPGSKGRKFLMGFVETAALGGDLQSAVLTALATALAHYLADELVTTGNELIVGVIRKGVEQFLAFANGSVNSVVGTQRRRRPGVGA